MAGWVIFLSAYYNEIDEGKAEWLRELMRKGVILDGEVDTRSIKEVKAKDLYGFTQCHFFAGIGVWSYSLRLAGWPDDRPVWTGSCPCPSFSAAGQGRGFDDPRHLWPDWSRLIGECRPATIFGEQVDDAIGHGWLDLVQTDLERQAYAVGKAVLGACSVGAPHIRQRLYFVADAQCRGGHDGRRLHRGCAKQGERDETAIGSELRIETERDSSTIGMAESAGSRRTEAREHNGGSPPLSSRSVECGGTGSMADADGGDPSAERQQRSGEYRQQSQDGGIGERLADTERRRCEQRNESERPISKSDEDRELGDASQRGRGMCGSASGNTGRPAQSEPTGDVGITEREGLERHFGNGGNGNESGRQPTFETGSTAAAGKSFWSDADWIWCRDGKYRPVRPGSFPLAHGAPFRVLRLRGYGDAINAEVAKAFIGAYIEISR
jgi:DNA (cytosine-5)-methyltransferase 1